MSVSITTLVIWKEADDLQSAVTGRQTNIVFVCEASVFVCPLRLGTHFHLSLRSLNGAKWDSNKNTSREAV